MLASAAVTSFAMESYGPGFAGRRHRPAIPFAGGPGLLPLLPSDGGRPLVVHASSAAGAVLAGLLDSAVGALGAAAVLAGVGPSPVLDSAVEGPLSVPSLVAVAFPVSDVVLVATVVGIPATRGLRFGYRWTLLALGLMVLAASDVVYALRLSTGDYAVGTVLDAGWAIGLTLVAGRGRRRRAYPLRGSLY